MNAKLLTFAAGAACGVLGMVLFNRPSDDTPAPAGEPTKALSIKPDRQAEKIAALEKKIEELEARQPSLIASSDEGDDGDKPAAKTSIKIFGDGESKIDFAEMQAHMKKAEAERSAKRVKANLATLSRTLNLSDEQAEKVRALLEKKESTKQDRIGSIMKLTTSAISGEDVEGLVSGLVTDGDGAEESGGEEFDFDAELLALLDDDQAAAYQDYVSSQNENHIEANANRQLAQLQTTIPDLTKEQKDQAFSEFARIARDDVEANGRPEDGTFPDVKRMMSQREAEKQAMKEILTEEQFGVYESNNMRAITFGAPAGATIISSDITIDASGGEVPIELPNPE